VGLPAGFITISAFWTDKQASGSLPRQVAAPALLEATSPDNNKNNKKGVVVGILMVSVGSYRIYLFFVVVVRRAAENISKEHQEESSRFMVNGLLVRVDILDSDSIRGFFYRGPSGGPRLR